MTEEGAIGRSGVTATAGTIAVPAPDLTPEDMVGRAAALRPLLLEQQAATEQRGTYSPELHEEFRRAGFYRILQPRRFGGYEFDLPTYFRVVMELGRGDPGAAWCLSLGAGHVLPVASHFSAAAQEEFFRPHGEFVAPHSATPRGTATPVDDGYVVTGDWAYSSGIPYSTHFLGTARVVGSNSGSAPDPEIVFVLARDQYTVLDDWGGGATLGLQGSGSNTARVGDVHVPQAHTSSWNWLASEVRGETPGTALHGNPMYLGQCGALYAGEIGAVQVGAAWAAIDEFERLIRIRKTQFPPIRLRMLDPSVQQVLGTAISWADAAEAALLRAGEMYMRQCRHWADTGVGPTPEETLRLNGIIQTSMRLSWEVVQLVWASAGSSVTKAGERMQKYFRDLGMVQGQRSDAFQMVAGRIARLHLGVADAEVPAVEESLHPTEADISQKG